MNKDHMQKQSIFSLGEKAGENFTGEVYFRLVFNDSEPLNAPIANVTFAPGARTKWHSHKVGQVIIITNGEGWYQEEGKKAQPLKKGDTVNFRAGVKHWHGATKDSWFEHLALTPGETDWFEAVDKLPEEK